MVQVALPSLKDTTTIVDIVQFPHLLAWDIPENMNKVRNLLGGIS